MYTANKSHMCPKDFTIVCIINTLLVPASLFMRYRWRFVWMKARVSERNSKARETGGLSIASNRVFCHTKMHDFEHYGASPS